MDFSWVSPRCSMDFPWFSACFPWVFPEGSLGFPMDFLDIPQVFLGLSPGFPYIFPKFSLECSLRCSLGFPSVWTYFSPILPPFWLHFDPILELFWLNLAPLGGSRGGAAKCLHFSSFLGSLWAPFGLHFGSKIDTFFDEKYHPFFD